MYFSISKMMIQLPHSPGLFELDKDTFYGYLKAQTDTLVVVDFYTGEYVCCVFPPEPPVL